MAPPSYNDLGKQARDLFNKHYHLGLVTLDVKTKTSSGLQFNVSGVSNNDTGKVLANLETKHEVKDYGLTFKEKWTTDNVLLGEITFQDKLIKGLKLGVNGSLTPQTGKKKAALTTSAKGDLINFSSDVDFDPMGTMVHCSVVIGSKGLLFGSQVSFDPNEKKLTKTNFAVGYITDDFALHTSLNEKSDFNGSIYQKVNESLQSAVSFGWSAGNSSTRLALGCIYKMDETTSLRAKINNNSQFSLGFAHRLRPGILLTLSSMIDVKNINEGGHKLGMGIELNAS